MEEGVKRQKPLAVSTFDQNWSIAQSSQGKGRFLDVLVDSLIPRASVLFFYFSDLYGIHTHTTETAGLPGV